MVKIIQRDNPILRANAGEVNPAAIASPEIKKIIANMKQALGKEHDGVAIAAPQIGQSLRIVIIAGKIFAPDFDEHKEEQKLKSIPPDVVLINPTITRRSKEKASVAEGCLSVRWLYGEVSRSVKATATAYNEAGKKITISGKGLLAQIFQHEVDHLEGILFIDTAKNIKEVPPEKDHA